MISTTISRRHFISALSMSCVAGVALAQGGDAASALEQPGEASFPGDWTSPRSANGWSIANPRETFVIEGAGLPIQLAVGSASTLLLHAARRINYELSELRPDDIAGAQSGTWVESRERSNLLSGTAFLYRPGAYPWGASGNLYPDEAAVFKDIVARSDGVLAWGGDLMSPDEGLVYVTSPPTDADVSQLAQQYSEADRMDANGGAGQFIALGSG